MTLPLQLPVLILPQSSLLLGEDCSVAINHQVLLTFPNLLLWEPGEVNVNVRMVMKIKIKFLILFHGSTFAPLLFVCILNWLLISIYFRINKVISGKGNSTYYAYSSNSLDIFILQRNCHLKSKILSFWNKTFLFW